MVSKYLKITAVSLLLLANIFIWIIVQAESDSSLSVYFLDVGQGDSILIISPVGNKMIIDGGPGNEVLSELSEILPFYDKKIDVVLATHPDADHVSGLIPVLERFKTDFIIESGVSADTRIFDDFQSQIEKSEAVKTLARRGMKIDLGGGAILLVLFPDRNISGVNSNDASVIAKLYFGETDFLLTSDAPIKMEDYLVSLDGEILKSDVLKVGHHGSKTSSSGDFVEVVSPQYAIIQAGRENKYGHPHGEVLEILKESQAKILGTYEMGTILITSDGANLNVDG